jgi:presenilin-like A22 family membrane protease
VKLFSYLCRKFVLIYDGKKNIYKRVFRVVCSEFVFAVYCMFCAAFVGKVDTSILRDLDKGVYAFLSITVLLSLFQDYKIIYYKIRELYKL